MSRARRSAADARRQILEAAEKQLAERGVEGIRVQDVADDLGIVPATVLHHFGSRDGLLDELMVFGSKRLRERIEDLIGAAKPDLVRLSADLFDLYESRGYAPLYASLSNEPDSDSEIDTPAFAPLLERLHETRGLSTKRLRERAAHAVLLLNLAAFGDALVGAPMREAVGLPDDDASRARFFRWLGGLLDEEIDEA